MLPSKGPATPISRGFIPISLVVVYHILQFQVPSLRQLTVSRARANQWVSEIGFSGVSARVPFLAQCVTSVFLNALRMAKQTPRLFLRVALQLHSFFMSLVIKTTDKTRTTNAPDFIASQDISQQAGPSLRRFSEEVL